jgi:hypothetical protein
MTSLKINAVALAAGLAFSTVAAAESMSKTQYESAEKRIEADHKAARATCNTLAGNTKAICVAEAEGKASVARADLLVQYQPSIEHSHDALVAKADATYAVAMDRCNAKGGNEKDVCVKEAKAAKVHAVADATAWMETAKADAAAKATSAGANAKAKEAGAEARQDAASDKLDADYTVAREKCDVLAGAAKDACLNDAKVRFGKK